MTVPYFRMVAAAGVLLLAAVSAAEVKTTAEHHGPAQATAEFKFTTVPPPSRSDAAGGARFALADGRPDPNGGGLDRLHDGKVPTDEDQPSENFFFAAGTAGGRILVDLGGAVEIKQVNTYSWHPTTRGPQVYTLYASDGAADGFRAQPPRGTDPETCGWKRVAAVDTRPAGGGSGGGGGQYGVSIAETGGVIGKYRYLLFDIARTEAADPFGNTFFSEIDVVDPAGPVLPAAPAAPGGAEPRIETVEAGGGTYRIAIDTTETPDLTPWVREDLAPVVKEWYPKIVQMLPSEGYEAPRRVGIAFSKNMQGVAGTWGTRVRCGAEWFRRNLKGEAKGAVVHELVHVVQQYGQARRVNPAPAATPGWLVEGIADYIRWFLYEPETRGAEISRRGLAAARYDGNYRISGNFLNWVAQEHGQKVIQQLNVAAREGRYSEDLWKQYTGRTVQELGDLWKENLKKRLEE